MRTALIGYSGFVGSTLLTQTTFDDLYRSTNIHEIEGRSYDFLVCAGAPAAKWKANRFPAEDAENLLRLERLLETTTAWTAVLVSTVDVYPRPIGVYEDSVIQEMEAHPYGRHRLNLEQFFTRHFSRAFVIRLPGLFGRGLRKNFIFDLIRNPQSLHLTHRDSIFQFYNMARLWDDLRRVTSRDVRLINMATPPVSARELARRCFGIKFDITTAAEPVQYDMRTHYASLFGATGEYIVSREEILNGISRFVEEETASA